MLAYVAVPLLTHRRNTGPGIGLTCPGAAKPRKQDFLKSITSMSSLKTTVYLSMSALPAVGSLTREVAI